MPKTERVYGLYSSLKRSGTLKAHCLEVQHRAEEQVERLVKQMATSEGVNETLKRTDQMEWVRRMNNIRSRAGEMVQNNIILRI